MSAAHRHVSGQRGFAAAEALVAMALLASAITAGVSGVSVLARVAGSGNKDVTGSVLVHSQLESIKGATYSAPSQCNYAQVPLPPNYTLTIVCSSVQHPPDPPLDPTTIEQVRVTVRKSGQLVQDATAYKANR